MRNLQVRLGDFLIAEKFDVDVEGARAEADFLFAVSPETRFDFMDFFEQIARGNSFVQKSCQSHIVEIILVEDVHRLGAIDRRDFNATEDFRKFENRAAEDFFGAQP